jgi:GxxExxY protein
MTGDHSPIEIHWSEPNKSEHGRNTSEIPHLGIAKSVVAGFFTVYDRLGFGDLENVYRGALDIELRRRGHSVAREVRVPVFYDRIRICHYTMDFVVDQVLTVEVKSTAALCTADKRQLLNYLRCTNFQVGLLLHFGPKPRFHRLVISTSPHRP